MDDGKRDFLKAGRTVRRGIGACWRRDGAGRWRWRRCSKPACAKTPCSRRCRKEGVLRVGYAQTGPWFYKDAKTGELDGIYKDVVDQLAEEIQVKVEWKEVTFANATVGAAARRLRPVRLVADLPVPARARGRSSSARYYSKGTLLLSTRTTPGASRRRPISTART